MRNSFKHLAAGVSMACAIAATADETAYEGQPIGSIAVSSTMTNTIVAVAFKELSPVDGQGVSVSNIISTVNLVNGDKIYLISGSQYHSWTLKDNFWTAVDQTLTVGGSGDSTSGKGAESDELRPDIGNGFWLQRVGDRAGAAMPDKFFIFGAVVETRSTVAAHGAKTLMGNPKLTAAQPTIENASFRDQINLIRGDGQMFDTYTFGKDGKWRHINQGINAVVEKVSIPAGGGFWYNSNGSKDVTFTW